MIDVEREIRDALRRQQFDVPELDLADGPAIVRRTRVRQARNGIGAIVLAALFVLGATTGVNALLRVEPDVPAVTPTPTPSAPFGLTPPPEAPIVVGSGTAEGWPWLLSASTDGTCVALTDRQGSDLTCDRGRSDLESEVVVGAEGPRDDIIDVGVRSPRPDAPSVVFVFGRVPGETAQIQLYTRTLDASSGDLFSAPAGVDLDVRYYVRWVPGYRYPYVPHGIVDAVDASGNGVETYPSDDALGSRIELPDWGVRPTFEVLETITSGHSDVGAEGRDWEIAVFRNEATGKLCLGEPGGASVCGPAENPVPGWEASVADLCARVGRCAWPPLDVIGGEGGGTPEGVASFAWGVFRAPVVSVRAQRFVLPNGFGSPSERNGWLESAVFDLPSHYGDPFRVFVYSCDDCLTGQTIGFDEAGEAVARV